MNSDLRSIRKIIPLMSFLGLLITSLDVLLVVSGWWMDFLEIWFLLVLGPILLISALLALIALCFSPSHLPEDWDTLSFEAKRDLAEKQLVEKHGRVGKMNRFTLKYLRSDAQRHHVEELIAERNNQ